MPMTSARADFFDASALVKVFCNEPWSDVIRDYFYKRHTKYTTPFCFYEAMNVLKSKWRDRGQLSKYDYLDAAFGLAAWFSASSANLPDVSFTDHATFLRAHDIATRTNLDLSDAFQIVSVKFGYYAPMMNESTTILVTADRGLAEVARNEGVKVWCPPAGEPVPT